MEKAIQFLVGYVLHDCSTDILRTADRFVLVSVIFF